MAQSFEYAHTQSWVWQTAPLRPDPQDIAITHQGLTQWSEANSIAQLHVQNALLLGVTPELMALCEQHALNLTAVDMSQKMIDAVWPGDTPMRRAILGNWLDLPIAPQSISVVLGDGITIFLDFPLGLKQLGQQLDTCMVPHGLLSLRCFVRPPQSESIEQVIRDVRQGKIGNFNIFKFRLLMALHGNTPQTGVLTSDACDVFEREFPDTEAFCKLTGWPPGVLSTMSMYKENPARYAFPTADEIAATLSPWFEFDACESGHYEFAERCPSLRFIRRTHEN